MEPISGELTGWQAWSIEQAQMARQRYEFRAIIEAATARAQAQLKKKELGSDPN